MAIYQAGTCTAELVREYMKRIAPDARVRKITTFKDMICVSLENGDVIYVSEKEIRHFKNDNSTRSIN